MFFDKLLKAINRNRKNTITRTEIFIFILYLNHFQELYFNIRGEKWHLSQIANFYNGYEEKEFLIFLRGRLLKSNFLLIKTNFLLINYHL